MSSCPTDILTSSAEVLADLQGKFIRQRIPASGSLDLTHRCNLNCIHCYLGDPAGCQAKLEDELTTNQWLAIIDQFTEIGCLSLLITGGEPLLRHDFIDIYRAAKYNGLLVTVFTNGTLITESILDLFEDLPPHAVEITLYGATAETYENVTGVPGSFRHCQDNIHTLLKHNIDLKLKTVILTKNSHELAMMRNFASELGLDFRLDAALFPRLNGDNTPVSFRIPASKAAAMEMDDPVRLQDWRTFFERMRGLPADDKLFNCGAGLTSFHIDPYGKLIPCLMVREPVFDLRTGSFQQGWTEVISKIREIKTGNDYKCSHCETRFLCGLCPGFSKLDQGSLKELSPYLCSLGKERFRIITDCSI